MYVITGATGHTGALISEALLKAGKSVRAIGRDENRLKNLVDMGAVPAVGELEDALFLNEAFKDAEAVYALIPPKWDLTEPWRDFQRKVSTSIAQALKNNAVPYVVLLSSNGAHLPEGAGPVTGLYELEQMLKAVPGLNVMSLRAGFFMQNMLANIGMIKHLGFFGYTLRDDLKMPMVHTNDIAEAAVKHLLNLDFKGFNYVFVSGERDLTMPEAAQILGKAIGKPDMKYVNFSASDSKAGMLQAGIPETIAEGYIEMFDALNSGRFLSDYQRTPENTTATSLEDFAQEFAAAYQQG